MYSRTFGFGMLDVTDGEQKSGNSSEYTLKNYGCLLTVPL
jgi:hypothetical protein